MKFDAPLASVLLLLALGGLAAAYYARPVPAPETPALVLPTTDNETFDLFAERGHVVVLDFFQVWCESCVILEDELKTVHAASNESEVRIVSVGLPDDNSLEQLRAYQEQHGINWTVARGGSDLVNTFDIIGFPTLVIVDPAGRITHHRGGLADAGAIQRLIGESRTGDSPVAEYPQYSLVGLALAGSLAAFFSPCAVGLLPGYVGHALRAGAAHGRHPVLHGTYMGALAALGLLLVFLGIGGLAFAFGRAIAPWVTFLGPLIGILLILVGALLLVRPYSAFLQRFFSPLTGWAARAGEARPGARSYFVYGMGYGAAAAGCTAPILLNLVALAATSGPSAGLGVVLAYAGGAAALLAAVTIIVAGAQRGAADWIRRNANKIETLSALLFIAAGAYLVWFAWRAGTLSF